MSVVDVLSLTQAQGAVVREELTCGHREAIDRTATVSFGGAPANTFKYTL